MKLNTEKGELVINSDVFTTITGAAATNCYVEYQEITTIITRKSLIFSIITYLFEIDCKVQ